ncbi:MAG: 3-phosphoglycerate dehydrogenase, partial [Bacteroidetes bacterium]|nr:3-phosphoglycerate dehydrogenase [Bacteroidota bacterium]
NDSYKNISTGDFSTLKKNYAKGTELRGKTIGIVGFGRIGQSLASYAYGIGMHVIAIDQNEYVADIPVNVGNQSIIIPCKTHTNLTKVLDQMDFISLHVPKQSDGSAVIASNEFDKMKKGAILVNAARGGVINEDDLLNALDTGKIAGCALDVFENEPNPRKDLLNHPKIACTPHIGAATIEAQDRIGEELAALIIKEFRTI